jgi:hypothetical protein
MSDETLAVDEYIYRQLTEDASTTALIAQRVYGEQAPAGADLPLILFNNLSALDVRGSGNTRIMIDGLWVIRAVVQDGSYNATARALAACIDRLFRDGTSRAVDDNKALVFQSHREQPYRLVDEQSGKPFRHLGGIYRFYAQSTED